MSTVRKNREKNLFTHDIFTFKFRNSIDHIIIIIFLFVLLLKRTIYTYTRVGIYMNLNIFNFT